MNFIRSKDKIITVILSASFLLTGCSRLEDLLTEVTRTDPMGYTPEQIHQEIMPEVAETVVSALESGDEDKLRSVFSKKAKKMAKDMDLGVKFIYDIYSGKHKEIRDYQYSQVQHYEKNADVNEISCHASVDTDGKTYKLQWEQFLCDDDDPDNVGVWNLGLYVYNKTEHLGGTLAGIDYPERYTASYLSSVIGTISNRLGGTADEVRLVTSENLLWSMDDEGKDEYIKAFLSIDSNNILDRWVSVYTLGGQVDEVRCFVSFENGGKYVAYFTYDIDGADKITAFKITPYSGKVPSEDELICGEDEVLGVSEYLDKADVTAEPSSGSVSNSEDLTKSRQIEFDGKTLNSIPGISMAMKPDGRSLGNYEEDGHSYSVYRVDSSSGYEIYWINRELFCDPKDLDTILDYYENRADLTFTYYEAGDKGTVKETIDFDRDLFNSLRSRYSRGEPDLTGRTSEIVKNFQILARSSDGVFDSSISIGCLNDQVILIKTTDSNGILKGYSISRDEAEKIKKIVK